MDPFNALAIATALLQFTEFGIKVLGEVKSVHKTGNTITGNDLANTAKECKDLTATLKKRASRRSSPESELLDQHEQVSFRWIWQASHSCTTQSTGPSATISLNSSFKPVDHLFGECEQA